MIFTSLLYSLSWKWIFGKHVVILCFLALCNRSAFFFKFAYIALADGLSYFLQQTQFRKPCGHCSLFIQIPDVMLHSELLTVFFQALGFSNLGQYELILAVRCSRFFFYFHGVFPVSFCCELSGKWCYFSDWFANVWICRCAWSSHWRCCRRMSQSHSSRSRWADVTPEGSGWGGVGYWLPQVDSDDDFLVAPEKAALLRHPPYSK